MRRKCDALVFVGMTYPWGLIRHFALLGVELFRQEPVGCDVYYASIYRDADRGGWRTVNDGIPQQRILRAERFDQLLDRIVALTDDYRKVAIHCGGGWGQSIELLKLRFRIGARRWKRLRLLATTHSFNNGTWKRIPVSLVHLFLYLLIYDKVIFPCRWIVKRFIGGRLLFALNKAVVVPLGCESMPEIEEEYAPHAITESGVADLLLDNRLTKFVYLAAFRPGKMHTWLVRAACPVLRRHPDVRLLLCGTGSEKIIADVRQAIEKMGLSDRVLLTGQIPRADIPWLLIHCTCAIVPSRSETFGHCFLEPMFMGVPVLGTAVGIGADVIVDGETGFVFSLNDQKSLSGRMEWIADNKDAAKTMGQAAKCRVEGEFLHSAVASTLHVIYESVFNKVDAPPEPCGENVSKDGFSKGCSTMVKTVDELRDEVSRLKEQGVTSLARASVVVSLVAGVLGAKDAECEGYGELLESAFSAGVIDKDLKKALSSIVACRRNNKAISVVGVRIVDKVMNENLQLVLKGGKDDGQSAH